MPGFWTPERVETMRRLALLGYSAGRIAAEIGATRNQVLGKAARLGARLARPLPVRKAPVFEPPAPRKEPAERKASVPEPPAPRKEPAERKASVPEPPAPPAGPVEPMLVAVWDLCDEHCRWPYGEAKDMETFRYCGLPQAKGSPWCAGHHALAYARSP